MATTNNDAFARLDSLQLDSFSQSNRGSVFDGFSDDFTAPGNWSGSTSLAIGEAKTISANTSDKAYRKLTSHGNVTSYSLLSRLHECPRAFELAKLQANHASSAEQVGDRAANIDFAFGHAIGAGIQTYAATGSVQASIFAAMLAWKAPWDAEKLDSAGRPTGKSLVGVTLAVEKFHYWWREHMADYEVLTLPGKRCEECGGAGSKMYMTSGHGPDDYEYEAECDCCKGGGYLSGKKATELAFAVDFQNGNYHFGHIDTVLRNRVTNRLAVWEGKTTGLENIKEATYANSSQALGYSVVIEHIAQQMPEVDGTEYEVLYIVYSSKTRDFLLLPFTKTKTMRAEWLQDVLLDHANIATYDRIGFYPKRGDSCINKFGRECEYFGTCNMKNSVLFPGLQVPVLSDIHGIESLDVALKLDDLVESQK